MLVLLVLQLGFVYLPFMNTLFGTSPLGWRDWLIPIGLGFAVFVIVELEKAAMRRGDRRRA